jgi:thiamine pyrophosphate-dependent acetolactate synthase large subunit-like protein
MNRFGCAELIKAKLAADDIVVCGLGSVEAAYKQVGPAGPTYFASDPMGLWPSIALGLALARPDRRVVLLAGDGDLLMNLQVLATIAAVAPKNFRIVLFQNGSYASSGGQSLGAVDGLSFAAIARGAGFAWSFETWAEEDTRRQLDELFGRDGLGFLAVHVQRDISQGERPGPWSQAEERAVFMRSIAP